MYNFNVEFTATTTELKTKRFTNLGIVHEQHWIDTIGKVSEWVWL